MISPDEYALAISKVVSQRVSAQVVDAPGKILYEIRIGDRLVERVEKDHAIAFLDGVIAGFNLARQK